MPPKGQKIASIQYWFSVSSLARRDLSRFFFNLLMKLCTVGDEWVFTTDEHWRTVFWNSSTICRHCSFLYPVLFLQLIFVQIFWDVLLQSNSKRNIIFHEIVKYILVWMKYGFMKFANYFQITFFRIGFGTCDLFTLCTTWCNTADYMLVRSIKSVCSIFNRGFYQPSCLSSFVF